MSSTVSGRSWLATGRECVALTHVTETGAKHCVQRSFDFHGKRNGYSPDQRADHLTLLILTTPTSENQPTAWTMYELEIRQRWKARPRSRRAARFVDGFYMEVRHLLIGRCTGDPAVRLQQVLQDLVET